MTVAAGHPKVASIADLFAVAYQIEADAVERYDLLADQMATHNNPELVAVFRDLSRAEAIHRDEICRIADGIDVVAHAQEWPSGIGARARGREFGRGALSDDAVACAAAGARSRATRIGLLPIRCRVSEGPGHQKAGR